MLLWTLWFRKTVEVKETIQNKLEKAGKMKNSGRSRLIVPPSCGFCFPRITSASSLEMEQDGKRLGNGRIEGGRCSTFKRASGVTHQHARTPAESMSMQI